MFNFDQAVYDDYYGHFLSSDSQPGVTVWHFGLSDCRGQEWYSHLVVRARDAVAQDKAQGRPPQRIGEKPWCGVMLLAIFVSEKMSQIVTDLDQVYVIP